MNRRTFNAGSHLKRLVVMGVLAAFCLVMFGPSVQAYSRDQVKTQMTVMPKASDDPWVIDRIAPLVQSWFGKLKDLFRFQRESLPPAQIQQQTQPNNPPNSESKNEPTSGSQISG
jgi:hypothetical protein